MADIPAYPGLTPLVGNELLVVSDSNNETRTRTITINDILALTGSGVGSWQAVMNVGNTSVSNATLTGDFRNIGTSWIDTVNIDGGAIDGTIIGGAVTAAGSFTTIAASGAATFSSTAAITSNATIGGTLGVTGTSTLGDLNADATNFQGTVTIGGVAMSNVTMNDALNVTGLSTLATVDINGGNVDGTVIGGATPAAGSFTTLTTTGAFTPSGDIDIGNGDDISVNPTGGIGDHTFLHVRATPNIKISSIAANPAVAPTKLGLWGDAGIELDAGTGTTDVINTLALYTGANNDVADITAGAAKTIISKAWYETLSAARIVDLAGFQLRYNNVTAGVGFGGDCPGGAQVAFRDTTGGIALPSLTDAEEAALVPTLAIEGIEWYNEDQEEVKICTKPGNQALGYQPFGAAEVNAVTTPYTIADGINFVYCDTSAAVITVNLPAAINRTRGARIVIKDKDTNAGVRNITVTPFAGNTMDNGGGSRVIAVNDGYIELVNDGISNWWILGMRLT